MKKVDTKNIKLALDHLLSIIEDREAMEKYIDNDQLKFSIVVQTPTSYESYVDGYSETPYVKLKPLFLHKHGYFIFGIPVVNYNNAFLSFLVILDGYIPDWRNSTDLHILQFHPSLEFKHIYDEKHYNSRQFTDQCVLDTFQTYAYHQEFVFGKDKEENNLKNDVNYHGLYVPSKIHRVHRELAKLIATDSLVKLPLKKFYRRNLV